MTSATYGLSDCQSDTGKCCPEETDCKIPVTGEYLETIEANCNGRQRCDSNLRALWTSASECGASGETDYVTIHYDCLQGKYIKAKQSFAQCESYHSLSVLAWILTLMLLISKLEIKHWELKFLKKKSVLCPQFYSFDQISKVSRLLRL